MNKHPWLNIIIAGALLLSLAVLITPMFAVRGMARPTAALAVPAQASEAAAVGPNAAQLAGDYSGVVELQFTAAGVLSDTLATPPPPAAGQPEPPDMGTIDLALKLYQNNSTVSGYVSLDKTLVFTGTHTIKNGNTTIKTGPNVSGSFNGTNLTLLSERVAATLSGQPIQRQFRLSGAISASDGSRISGQYRETIWGATHQPVTVLGAFTLQRPVFATGAPDTSNKAPNTAADTATTPRGKAVRINVLANDTDPNGDALTITAVSRPQFGAATTNGQNVTYTPNVGFAGQDSFSYFVSDGHGHTTAGSVTVTVGGQLRGYVIYLPLVRR
jgi:Bacterial Ig domain